MTALYNEIDNFAADWLENLIAAGQIAPGVVDRRSIEDLEPEYVRQFTQVHFFAGVGIWSLGARAAGWPDDRPLWSGSCPCQPFSSAGQGNGFADERHLWPTMHHLIEVCRPDIVLGEQVASKDGLAWFDLVQSDLEGSGYAAGATDTCAAGFGAPHIRQRLWWAGVLGDARRPRLQGHRGHGDDGNQPGRLAAFPAGPDAPASIPSRVAHPHDPERRPDLPAGHEPLRPDAGRPENSGHVGPSGGRGGLADTDGGEQSGRGVFQLGQGGGSGFEPCEEQRFAGLCAPDGLADAQHDGPGQYGERVGSETRAGQGGSRERQWLRTDPADGGAACGPGPVNGLWRNADWLFCRDNKWRPVEPGTFPLAHALPRGMGTMGAGLSGLVGMAGLDGRSLARAKRFRTGTLKGFGNGLNLAQTIAHIEAVMEYLDR